MHISNSNYTKTLNINKQSSSDSKHNGRQHVTWPDLTWPHFSTIMISMLIPILSHRPTAAARHWQRTPCWQNSAYCLAMMHPVDMCLVDNAPCRRSLTPIPSFHPSPTCPLTLFLQFPPHSPPPPPPHPHPPPRPHIHPRPCPCPHSCIPTNSFFLFLFFAFSYSCSWWIPAHQLTPASLGNGPC